MAEVVGLEIETVEQRLKSFLSQLQSEFGILDRIVYKNKNQHRRCSYFQYLMKVRRDLRLLKSANPEEIFSASFDVINGKRPRQKVQLLESLKRRRTDSNKHNFLDRLLGVAHLLSQMTEPMLKAATQVSTLLARSFFLGFSLTVLALLARIRVLVQQMLLDVVFVFNRVSSLSQKEQAVRLTQERFEVFREYYPAKQQPTFLECIWETDKYRLIEKKGASEVENQEKKIKEDACIETSKIKYQSVEIFLGEDECDKTVPDEVNVERSSSLNKKDKSSLLSPIPEINDDETQVPPGSDIAVSPDKSIFSTGSGMLKSDAEVKIKPKAKRNVAFVSVKRPAPSPSSVNEPGHCLQGKEKGGSSTTEEDPFFSLLTGGNKKSTLF
ncbi:PREDICTED: uncharacterized protein LOC109181972 [Ipomoea nil]|uniref:uncharacterized protein LOC109181972 n=1 Tax=Ipomoea nil TaxID=35883 RepID=UPI000901A547|nr:PREDICTED: uncharacterized protein LOC109181972 [Ipomoea nil]XP_019187507.1 PREDICTED: uncharacterized protein LOC109181972 [Ipomoea nil]XP_019187508.1 PREDICTED: uncharacterized protein LOC109181972 [Ipomoea nil]